MSEALPGQTPLRVGDRVLVTSVEEAGEVTAVFETGAVYVRLDGSGDVIAAGPPTVVPEVPRA